MATPNKLYDYLLSYQFSVNGADEAERKIGATTQKINLHTSKVSQAEESIKRLTDVLQAKGVSGSKIEGILKDFGAGLPAVKLTTEEMASLTGALQKAGISGGQLKSIQTTLQGVGQTTSANISKMNDFERAMSRALIVAPVWMALRSVMTAISSAIGDNIKFLIELETAMARIQVVGKGTKEDFAKLREELVLLAVAYGVSATDAANAAVIFAQQGKTVAETIELTKTAMLGAQVLGAKIETTVENMTAAMNGFKIPAEQSISIINKWINVEKNFAVTSQDLANATKAAGATAKQMGVSLSEFLGDITAVIEVTRKSGSEAGNALNFIYARIHTTAKNVLQNIADIPVYITKTGEATKSAQPQLRTATDILDELALKWNNLSNAQQIEISTSLGSKRNLVSISALMQNHTRSIEARIAALNSSMSAEKAFAILQETTAVKLKKLDSAWKQLGATFEASDLFSNLINMGQGLIFMLEIAIDKTNAVRNAFKVVNEELTTKYKGEISGVEDFKEMLALQDKLSKSPKSNAVESLKQQVSSAINDYTQNKLKLKAAIEIGNKEKIQEELYQIQKNAAIQAAVAETDLYHQPRIETLRARLANPNIPINSANKQIQDLQDKADPQRLLVRKEMAAAELAIQNAQNFGYEKYLGKQGESLKLTAEEIRQKYDEIMAQIKLTDKQEESLAIERQLYEESVKNGDNKIKNIQKQIELISASEYQYDGANAGAEKNNAIKKLKLEIIKEQNIEKEKDISNAIELLSLTRATSRQLLDAEIALKSQILGTDSVINNEKIRLRILKEQTKEMLNQVNISDDTVKLYKIAKESGVSVAAGVGQFLTGQINFSQLKEMPRVLEAFKKQFSQRYEQLQAAEYFGISFRGSNIRGMGGYIPTAESEANRRIQNIGRETSAQQIQRNINVSGLQVSVNVSKEETSGVTKEEMMKTIFNKMSESKEFNSIVENILENY